MAGAFSFRGITNPNNQCYANGLLQVLFASEKMRTYFSRAKAKDAAVFYPTSFNSLFEKLLNVWTAYSNGSSDDDLKKSVEIMINAFATIPGVTQHPGGQGDPAELALRIFQGNDVPLDLVRGAEKTTLEGLVARAGNVVKCPNAIHVASGVPLMNCFIDPTFVSSLGSLTELDDTEIEFRRTFSDSKRLAVLRAEASSDGPASKLLGEHKEITGAGSQVAFSPDVEFRKAQWKQKYAQFKNRGFKLGLCVAEPPGTRLARILAKNPDVFDYVHDLKADPTAETAMTTEDFLARLSSKFVTKYHRYKELSMAERRKEIEKKEYVRWSLKVDPVLLISGTESAQTIKERIDYALSLHDDRATESGCTFIRNTPDVLIVCVRRVDHEVPGSTSHTTTKIEFPTTGLDKGFMLQTKNYTLRGAYQHFGTATGGHYIAHVKTPNDDGFITINDSTTTSIAEDVFYTRCEKADGFVFERND